MLFCDNYWLYWLYSFSRILCVCLQLRSDNCSIKETFDLIWFGLTADLTVWPYRALVSSQQPQAKPSQEYRDRIRRFPTKTLSSSTVTSVRRLPGVIDEDAGHHCDGNLVYGWTCQSSNPQLRVILVRATCTPKPRIKWRCASDSLWSVCSHQIDIRYQCLVGFCWMPKHASSRRNFSSPAFSFWRISDKYVPAVLHISCNPQD